MKKRIVKVVKTREQLTLYERPKTGRLVPCQGTAHSNPFIDHCMTCAPRWGEVEEKGGLAIYVGDVADAPPMGTPAPPRMGGTPQRMACGLPPHLDKQSKRRSINANGFR